MTHPPRYRTQPQGTPYGMPSPPLEANGWGKYVSGAIETLKVQATYLDQDVSELKAEQQEHGRKLTEIHGHIIRLQTQGEMEKDEPESKPAGLTWGDRVEFVKEITIALRWLVGIITLLAVLLRQIDWQKAEAIKGWFPPTSVH